MKRTLKGRGRYFPGSLYGLLIGLPLIVPGAFLLVILEDRLSGKEIVLIVLFIAFLALITFLTIKAGKAIFDFTERKLSNICKTAESAHSWAVAMEFGIFFGLLLLLLLAMGAVYLIMKLSAGSAPEVSESVNGWD